MMLLAQSSWVVCLGDRETRGRCSGRSSFRYQRSMQPRRDFVAAPKIPFQLTPSDSLIKCSKWSLLFLSVQQGLPSSPESCMSFCGTVEDGYSVDGMWMQVARPKVGEVEPILKNVACCWSRPGLDGSRSTFVLQKIMSGADRPAGRCKIGDPRSMTVWVAY